MRSAIRDLNFFGTGESSSSPSPKKKLKHQDEVSPEVQKGYVEQLPDLTEPGVEKVMSSTDPFTWPFAPPSCRDTFCPYDFAIALEYNRDLIGFLKVLSSLNQGHDLKCSEEMSKDTPYNWNEVSPGQTMDLEDTVFNRIAQLADRDGHLDETLIPRMYRSLAAEKKQVITYTRVSTSSSSFSLTAANLSQKVRGRLVEKGR